MSKKILRLQPFCNFYSQYSPTKSTLTVRRLSISGITIKKWTVYVSNERFERIMSETDNLYNVGVAAGYNTNAAEYLLMRAGWGEDEI
jgi:cellulase/cellobiase CelA1